MDEITNFNPEVVKLASQQGISLIKHTAQSIGNRMRLAKASDNKDDTINELEQIIRDMTSEINKLVGIIQMYEQELIAQKISDKDIEFIASEIIPLVEQILKESDDEDFNKISDSIKVLKPLLSKETLHILQLVGFNFKKAIGDPLTHLIAQSIASNTPLSKEQNLEYQMLVEQRSIQYWKTVQNKEAYQRHLKLKREE